MLPLRASSGLLAAAILAAAATSVSARGSARLHRAMAAEEARIQAVPEEEAAPASKQRSDRALSLFSIVQFKNEECTTASDSDTQGTCMTREDCQNDGGSVDGNCAAGFGVCCVFVAACGTDSTVTKNCTYLRNAEFPATASASTTCTFNFDRICDNLCQIRLDFDTLSTAAPPTTGADAGTCTVSTDTVVATSPTGQNPPTVCGLLTGQHMFLETGTTGSAGSIVFTFGAGTATNRMVNTKVTYYTCDSENKAPADCVQYFTGTSGSIMSYNFLGGTALEGQSYFNCIRQEEGFCSIEYSESATTSPDPFGLFGATADTVGTAASTTCTETFVGIPSTLLPGNLDILCGAVFSGVDADTTPGTVRSDQTPFRLQVFFDSTFGTTTAVPAAATGFNLDYTQVPCGSV